MDVQGDHLPQREVFFVERNCRHNTTSSVTAENFLLEQLGKSHDLHSSNQQSGLTWGKLLHVRRRCQF